MSERIVSRNEGLTPEQVDTFALDAIANIAWIQEQSLGEAPNIAMFIATAFPEDPLTARVITQRALAFLSNPEDMESRRAEIFGTK